MIEIRNNTLNIREVSSKSDLRTFIHLPAKIHKNHSNWVPPLYSDEFVYFSPKHNKSFEYCDTQLLLLYENDKPVGRIMFIINNLYNQLHNEKTARFCYLECYDNPLYVTYLLECAKAWAIEREMVKLVGPLGFSDKDPQGMMNEGFDKSIVLATNGNLPYMPKYVENAGFSKELDLVVYKIDIPPSIPLSHARVYERILTSTSYVVKEFHRRNELKPFVHPILHLVNETYSHIFGFAPLSEKEMDEFADRYLSILDPDFVKVILDKQNQVIAFVISMPDISNGIKKSKGYLWPIGIFQILASARKTKQLNLLLGAVKINHRNKGLDTVLGVKLFETARKRNLAFIDTHLIMETNTLMRAECEKLDGVVYKRYRIFSTKLV